MLSFKDNINTIITKNIDKLTKKDKYLLLLIGTHKSSIDIKLLNQLYLVKEYSVLEKMFNFEFELDNLVSKTFLEKDNYKYSIQNHTIKEYIFSDKFKKEHIEMNEFWINIYKNIDNNTIPYFIPKSKIIYKLASFK